MNNDKNAVLKNVDIKFRNFAGAEKKFNPAGRRSFCIFLEPEIAQDMAKDGWNIKKLVPKDDDDIEVPYIQVFVSDKYYPTRIYLISGENKTKIRFNSMAILDWIDIESADVTLRPYYWEVNDKSGIKAYAKDIHIRVSEEDFDDVRLEMEYDESEPLHVSSEDIND